MDTNTWKAWIVALRSGKYRQGTNALKSYSCDEESREKFCCLGVLADVIHPQGWRQRDWYAPGAEEEGYCSNSASAAPLPSEIMAEELQQQFVTMNDKRYFTFSEIADAAEHIMQKELKHETP